MNAIPYGQGETRSGRPATFSGHPPAAAVELLDLNDSIRLCRVQRVLKEQAKAPDEPEAPEAAVALAELLPPLTSSIRAEGPYLVRAVDRDFLQLLPDGRTRPVPEPAQEAVVVPETFARIRRRPPGMRRLPSSSWLAGIVALLAAAGITAGAVRGLDAQPSAAPPPILPSASPADIAAAPPRPTPTQIVATAPSPPRPSAIYGHALVVDSATILVDGREVHLAGLRGESGAHAERLRSLIAAHGGVLACHAHSTGYACLLPGRLDIASWALRNGAAQRAADAATEPSAARRRSATP